MPEQKLNFGTTSLNKSFAFWLDKSKPLQVNCLDFNELQTDLACETSAGEPFRVIGAISGDRNSMYVKNIDEKCGEMMGE